jgi:hypothetical protein
MDKKFDPTKPVQLDDGRPARVICTNKKSPYPIVAIYADSAGEEVATAFDPAGRSRSSKRLVNIPVETVEFINYFGKQPPSVVRARATKAECDGTPHARHREACLKVTKIDGHIVKVEVVS